MNTITINLSTLNPDDLEALIKVLAANRLATNNEDYTFLLRVYESIVGRKDAKAFLDSIK